MYYTLYLDGLILAKSYAFPELSFRDCYNMEVTLCDAS